ncbi:uncharacterized protein PHACADRAFT_107707 [Phanerochaete carnosa HHB-10118-sp]|uniref:Uncharacterized protein n=1 Tax=Phanerochaete carnosa (strain HHB-10118-sp) TaxID=650164 RepID=K5WFP9_PHACS|nr:uncharacterized protein PHACADRAFT_107707 [Phanerochaete carnosa HHB-10118-sp]EKM49017.1 hypothetical protein PHACADRAFT_107707 [Phanerochaete carnosa HHB-10118-sp]
MQAVRSLRPLPFTPFDADVQLGWSPSADRPSFDWWPGVTRRIKCHNRVEYDAMHAFIDSRTLSQRAQSHDISTTSGLGFQRVYVDTYLSQYENVFAKLDGLLCEGDFISLWMGRCRSRPQRTWINLVGQIVRFKVFWDGHVTVEVCGSRVGWELTVFLTFRIRDISPPSAIASPAWKWTATPCTKYIRRPAPLPLPPRQQALQPTTASDHAEHAALASSGAVFDMEVFGVAPAFRLH